MFERPELFRENVAYFDRPATKICVFGIVKYFFYLV